MTRPYLRERRAQRIAEGQQDMANRCGFCKKPIPLGRVQCWFRANDNAKYCSHNCFLDAGEAEEQRKLMEARR